MKLCPESIFLLSGRGRGFRRTDWTEFRGNVLMFEFENSWNKVNSECNYPKIISDDFMITDLISQETKMNCVKMARFFFCFFLKSHTH